MPRKNSGSDRVAMQNAIKTLAANIRFSSVDNPIHSIAVVSSVPSEGKTTISMGLGRAFADSGATVLLVECDMRRRSLASALGVHGKHGIYSVLSGHHTLQESAVAAGVPNLYFLDAEPGIPNPADILQSRRFHEFVRTATQTYNYVVFDTPPILTFVDAAVVSSIVDATLLVVRQDFTKREDVRDSFAQLNQAGANVIGTVLNCTDAEVSSKYYDYYHEKKNSSYDTVRPASSVQMAERASIDGVPDQAGYAAAGGASAAPASQGLRPAVSATRVSAPEPRQATPAAGRAVFSPAKRRGASASPDETSQFLASAGYVPRYSSDDASGANEGE